jgi:hypothetical protein
MKKFIGIMLAMTLCPIANIDNLWKDEDDGFIPALRFGAKTGLSKGRFKAIRYHFATGQVGAGSKTFDAFRPIQDCFNNRPLRMVTISLGTSKRVTAALHSITFAAFSMRSRCAERPQLFT